MNIAKLQYPACRALARLVCDNEDRFDYATEAAWDGGEWSGPALDRCWQREYSRLCDHVAQRFSIETHQLDHDYFIYYNQQAQLDWEAVMEQPLQPIPYGDTVATLTESRHTGICAEYWDRGLDCQCIPDGVKRDIRNGASPEEVM